MADLRRFKKFVQLVKVDEAKREVGGVVTAEVEDKDGEVCHYASTKPHYEAWSDEMKKASDGKNLGNLREMHGLSAAGVGKAIEFRDVEKEIWMTFKVVDDVAWNKVEEGVYTGFSQGGEYVSTWPQDGLKWYTASPSEVSLVDNPCLGVAHFDFIRADGTKEVRKFKQKVEETMATIAVPAIDEASLRKFITDELGKAKEVERAAAAKVAADLKLRKFCDEQSMSIIEKESQKLGVKIEKSADGVKVQLRKGMYEVGTMARMLSDLCYLRINQTYEQAYEQDSSKIPEALHANLESLAQTFLAMAKEETQELLESAAGAGKSEGGVLAMADKTGDLLKAAHKSLAGHLKKMADCVTDHHEKVHKAASTHFEHMKKMAKDHHDEMHGHIDKMHKIIGAEEDDEFAGSRPGTNEPEAITPQTAGAAPNLQHAAGMTEDAVKKMIADAVEKTKKEAREEAEAAVTDMFIKALTAENAEAGTETSTAAAASVIHKVAEGVGNRAEVVRPAVRVMPVTKAEDDSAGLTVAAAGNDKIDMEKVRRGDPEEVRKFMKGVKPTSIPSTLVDVVSRAGGGR